ncbi:MAG: carboxylesterase/lipase family protein, partial [Anaerolineae bacterium]
NGPRAVQGGEPIFVNPQIGPYFAGGRADAAQNSYQPDSEDCLVLNVLTNGLSGKRPVMVYIHGGGFFNGSGALTLFANKFVREQDVVLVGINHRLNIFGYLYLGGLSSKYAQGNAGQLDLVAALEWVRDNITAFGGDPANVTIFGESGGGGKICALLGMPAARGLFARAIVESGSMIHNDTAEEATGTAHTILSNLELQDNQADELQRMPVEKLFGAISPKPGGPPLGMRLSPVVDGITLPAQAWEPAATPLAAGIAMLIGCCKDEATLFSQGNPKVFALDWDSLSAQLVQEELSAADAGTLVDIYRRAYPQESPSDLYFRIRTDRTMRPGGVRQAELKAAQGDPVYMYSFNWNTPLIDGKLRAFHTAELPLAMRLVLYPEAEQLSRQLAAAWASFARNGNPNNPLLPEWPQYTPEQRTTMTFDIPTCSAVNDPNGEARKFLRGKRLKGVL